MPASRSAIGRAHLLRVVRAGAGDRHQPGFALRDLVVPGAAALRAVVPEAGDGQHDQPRVQLVQRGEPETQPVEHPGAEVLHQYVRAADQLEQGLTIVVVLQVEGDGLLVAVGGQEVRRLRAGAVVRSRGLDEGRPPPARVVAHAGRLDLDDPGAQVAEHHRGVRARQGSGQVDRRACRTAGRPWWWEVGHDVAPQIQPGTTSAAQTRSGPASVTSKL